MAFNLENMTVDYKKLLNLVPTQRVQLAQSGMISDLIGALTPGQLANLFPRYYREQLPDIGQVNNYAARLDVALSGAPLTSKSSGGVTTYGNVVGKTMTPEEKAVKEIFDKAGLNQYGSGATSAMTDTKNRIISTASTNISPQERALLDTIAMGNATSGENYWESPNYNTIVGGQSFDSFEDHPRVFGTSTSTAAGRYQFTKTTWDDIKQRYNKENPDNPITDFSPENQDKAALYLAEKDYYRRTKRSLKDDLANPPENMGELIKYGLGGSGMNTTWQIFQKKGADEVQKAFESNYERNIGYVEEIEKAAAKVGELEETLVKFDPSMIGQLDSKLQTWYNSASEIQKQKFEKALEKLGTDQFNEIMKRQPVNSATLQAASVLKTSGDSILDPSLTRVSQEQAELAGTRKLPLQQELVDTMNYAAQKISEETGRNIYLKTFSGGQAAIGTAGPRTGSTEHDLGGAADNYFIEVLPDGTERRLNMSNPEDKQIMYRTAYHFARAGGRSIGLESGYMGDESVHFGISRNNEDPTHHADRTLSAMVEQGKAEFLQEANEKGWDPRYGYKDFYLQEKQKRQAEADAKLKTEADAIAQASPVSATENAIENNPSLANTSAPAMATGGLMNVPPGENVEIRNRDTKEVLAYANDRENIRVEPGELEGSQQAPVVTQQETQKLEMPMQQQQVNNPRISYPDTSDSSFAPIMLADTHYTPSSYERATLGATLRPERNVHFKPSRHT